MDSKEKNRFRTLKVWKDFRRLIIRERGPSCELCGTRYIPSRIKSLQLHHIDPEHYTDLIPPMFKLVCSGCHDTIELYERRLKAKVCTIANKEKWDNLLEGFLPIS